MRTGILVILKFFINLINREVIMAGTVTSHCKVLYGLNLSVNGMQMLNSYTFTTDLVKYISVGP